MIIDLQKFGHTLISRQSGREAFAAFQPNLRSISPSEDIEVSFEGILTFSPAWADEFITPLRKEFGSRLVLRHTGNPSVKASLEILELK